MKTVILIKQYTILRLTAMKIYCENILSMKLAIPIKGKTIVTAIITLEVLTTIFDANILSFFIF